jgi:hypothetical protein
MELPDPIQRSKDRLTALLDGSDEFAQPAQAEAARARALQNKEGGFGGRSLGFAVIDSQPRGDGTNYRVLVTDGEQEGVIVVRLSGTLLAVLPARGADAEEHLVERLQNAAGSLPNDGNRWLNMVLQDEPIEFGA